MASRSQHWERVRDLENALALLNDIETRRRIVRQQIWHEGDLTVAFAEVTAMGDDLRRFKEALSSRWHELFETARQEDANERD